MIDLHKRKQPTAAPWKVATGVLALLLVISCVMFATTAANNGKAAPAETTAAVTTEAVDDGAQADVLSLWTDNAPLKKQLTEYMAKITDKDSKDFIPVSDRIAVFDLDGTLCCETDPVYFDYRLFYYRVTEDPDYKGKASAEELETAEKIKVMMDTGESAEGLAVDHGKGVASAFKGMTLDEFDAYVKAFREKPAPSYEGMTNGQAFYKPMLQVVEYLQANDFTVYVVSGTDRLIVRGLVDGTLDIPASQVIGSDESLVALNQNGEDGLTYQYTKDDKVILGGDFLIKNLKMNKVSVIEQEIGRQPVLAFGNSSGDFSMAAFVTNGNQYPSAAFMLCCDDLERENGNLEKAAKMVTSCTENGWTTVSMKNDWTTIYGDGVTKKQPAATEAPTEALGKAA